MPTQRPRRPIDRPFDARLAIAIGVACAALIAVAVLLLRDRDQPGVSEIAREPSPQAVVAGGPAAAPDALRQLVDRAAPEIRRWILLDVRAGQACGAVRFEPVFRNYVKAPLHLPSGLSTADEANAFLGRAQNAIPLLPTYAPEPATAGRASPYHAMWMQTTAVAPQVFLFGFAADRAPPAGCHLEVRGSWSLVEPGSTPGTRRLFHGVTKWGDRVAVTDQRPILVLVAGAEGPTVGLHSPTGADAADWARLVPGATGPSRPLPAAPPDPTR